MKLSVLVPAYNEEGSIASTLRRSGSPSAPVVQQGQAQR